MKFKNRRKFHRINFDGKVNLQFADGSYDCCQIKNLSLTGMFVEGDFQKHSVEDCHIKLFHKETSGDNSLKATGKVVWGILHHCLQDFMGPQWTRCFEISLIPFNSWRRELHSGEADHDRGGVQDKLYPSPKRLFGKRLYGFHRPPNHGHTAQGVDNAIAKID